MKPRRLNKGEKGFFFIMMIVSAVFLAASVQMFVKSPKLNGEGTIPMVVSLVMLIMTILMQWEIRAFEKAFEPGRTLSEKAAETFAYLFPGKVGLICLYCILYAVLLGIVGFKISTFAFLLGSILTLNSEKKVQALIVSAATLAVILVLFQMIFKVRLP